MELKNTTSFEAAAVPFQGPDRKPVLTLIVKGTFEFQPDGIVNPAEKQIPIAYGDEVNSEGDLASVRFESDMAPFKPKSDIILVGQAHAPEGKTVQVLDVSLRVGETSKTIRVFGDRHWEVTGTILKETPSVPKPFSSMDIVYERAFGGIDMDGGGYCRENLAGVGFYAAKKRKSIKGAPLPNIEDPRMLIKTRKDCPTPAGFGYYGRAWEPRLGYLGTYDQKWRKERAPDLPDDFKFEFYNAAHPDLQINEYLYGTETVEMKHLTPEALVRFRLPGIRLGAAVTKYSGDDSSAFTEDDTFVEDVKFNLDTLCLLPEERQFFMVWRGLCLLRDLSAEEVKMIEIST